MFGITTPKLGRKSGEAKKASQPRRPKPVEPFGSSKPPLSQRLGTRALRTYAHGKKYTGRTLIYFNRIDGAIGFLIVLAMLWIHDGLAGAMMGQPKALPCAFLLFALLAYVQGQFRKGTGSAQLVVYGLLACMVAVVYGYFTVIGGDLTALLLSVSILMVLPGLFEMAEHNKLEQAKQAEWARKEEDLYERLVMVDALQQQGIQLNNQLGERLVEVSQVGGELKVSLGLAVVTKAAGEQEMAAKHQQMEEVFVQASAIGANATRAVPQPAAQQHLPPATQAYSPPAALPPQHDEQVHVGTVQESPQAFAWDEDGSFETSAAPSFDRDEFDARFGTGGD
ncbi:MAG TPA: hypothetical protein VF575_00980 [Candidatus Saccharimonadales bacterium]|jgi:hypothetical protein